MIYPPEFIERCKQVYPNWTELHETLRTGQTIVGRYLDDSQSDAIPTSVLKQTPVIELYALIARAEAKVELYREWCRLYDQQFPRKE